jgi:hypothetical protein
MKKTRYIIVDKEKGVFLGTYTPSDFGGDPSDKNIYALFASNNHLGLTQACSFKTAISAETYIKDVFPKNQGFKLKAFAIQTEQEFPSVVDIIKSGYGDYTHDMMDGLFNGEEFETLH